MVNDEDGNTGDDVDRHALRLCRYARRIVSPMGALSSLLFEEEVEFPATWYELVNRFDASKFVPLRAQAEHPEDYPHDWHGLTRWTLQPGEAQDIDDLDALALHVVTRCCAFGTMALKKRIKADRVKYRFVITDGQHAHCGVIVLAGEAVARVLAGGKRP